MIIAASYTSCYKIVLQNEDLKWSQSPKLKSLHFGSKLFTIRMVKVWPNMIIVMRLGKKCQNISNLNKKFMTEFIMELNASCFSFTCSLVEPNLKEFQSDLSIVPFVDPGSKGFTKSLLLSIIKPDIIEAWKRNNIDFPRKRWSTSI